MKFPFSDDNKRYHTWNYYLRHRFGGKVAKIPIDAGFTCPNIDGTKGVGGCIYCDNGSSSREHFGTRGVTCLREQFERGKTAMSKKWESCGYIIYLQAHSNTYAPIGELCRIYSEVISYEDVLGLSVATRPDCIDDKTAKLLADIAKEKFVMVELGLQTVHEKTAKLINRCHSYQEFLSAYELLTKLGLKVCVHIINGLPGETRDMMMETVKRVGALEPFSLKIHLLHIIEGTPIAKMYRQGKVDIFTLDEYVNLICDQLEYLPAQTVVQRLTGDGDKNKLLSPIWSTKKFVVLNEIDKEMARRGTMQGIKL